VLGGARHFGAHRGRRGVGAYRGGHPPTLFCVVLRQCCAVCRNKTVL